MLLLGHSGAASTLAAVTVFASHPVFARAVRRRHSVVLLTAAGAAAIARASTRSAISCTPSIDVSDRQFATRVRVCAAACVRLCAAARVRVCTRRCLLVCGWAAGAELGLRLRAQLLLRRPSKSLQVQLEHSRRYRCISLSTLRFAIANAHTALNRRTLPLTPELPATRESCYAAANTPKPMPRPMHVRSPPLEMRSCRHVQPQQCLRAAPSLLHFSSRAARKRKH